MDHLPLMVTAVTHQLYDAMSGVAGRHHAPDRDRDRGAVSLEQVLWFVAAGVAVAVIAAILFGRIRDAANDSPIDTIAPPAGQTP